MPHSATITGKWGPGYSLTSKVFQNISAARFDFNRGMLYLGLANGDTQEIAISSATTFTITLSSGNYSLTVS